MYRLLFSNDIHQFRPQFKLHIMCNNPPLVDGGDSGVKRRIRKIDYVSKFVDAENVDPSKHMYKCDPELATAFKEKHALKMEFTRFLLSHYDHMHEFTMPHVIRTQSAAYLEDNDPVLMFVRERVIKAPGSYFTLQQAKNYLYKHPNVQDSLKYDLQKILGVPCEKQRRIDKTKVFSVFMGYTIQMDTYNDDFE